MCSNKSGEAALETFREPGTYTAGCGEDVATLVALLGAALRWKGQQQCHLPTCFDGQDNGNAEEIVLVFPRTAGPYHTAYVSNASRRSTERCPCNHPSNRLRRTRHGGRFRCHWGLGGGHHNLAFSVAATLVAGTGTQGLSSISSTHRATLTFQTRSPLPPCLSQRHLAPHVSWLRSQ